MDRCSSSGAYIELKKLEKPAVWKKTDFGKEKVMNISLICFTRAGFETMKRIYGAISEKSVVSVNTDQVENFHKTIDAKNGQSGDGIVRTALWVSGRYALQLAEADAGVPYQAVPEGGLSEWTKAAFSRDDALIFVGACGIAVRVIAPYVRDKFHDPAVVCVDEAGRFVIPLLSGHVGGANRLAETVASGIGAVPVVTTATDVEKKFAVDVFAKDHGLVIADRKLAKEISADILAGEPVGVFSDFGFSERGKIPGGLFKERICKRNIWITVSGKEKKGIPADRVLRLIPRCTALGIGCKRGTPVEKVRAAVEKAVEQNGIDLRSVFAIASIDIKKQEQGIIDFAKELRVPFLTFSSEELNGQPGDFSESEFVRKTTGTGNVCERSAVAACRLGVKAEDCRILFRKEAVDGVTVAAAYYIGI